MAALGLVIAWVDSHFLTDRLTVNHEQELREKNCFLNAQPACQRPELTFEEIQRRQVDIYAGMKP